MTGGGEASGVATTEPEDEGQMWSAVSALLVCVCVCDYRSVVCRYVNICIHAYIPMLMSGTLGTCSQVFSFFFFIPHLDLKYFISCRMLN